MIKSFYQRIDMTMKKSKLILLITGIISILTSFILITIFSFPTMNGKQISFKSKYGEKDVTLKATYYENENATEAVLICPGYSCDRQKWKPFSNLFIKNGYSVMIFDYSGQGGSSSTIGFNNAKTDNIPEEIDDAIEKLSELSNVPYENITLMGHSMGGRMILRLMYDYNSDEAVTNVSKKPIKNIILFSPEVNYLFNAQASLFAGTSDANEEPWKSFNEDTIKGTNMYIYGSTSDDIVSDEDILRIYEKLGGIDVPESGKWENTQTLSNGSKITVGITSGILHSYMMYSPEFAEFANQALSNISNREMIYRPSDFLMVYFSWGFGLAGLFLTLFSLNLNLEKKTDDQTLVLIDSKKFLLRKLLLWLIGILFAGLICTITVIMPFGSPVMNTPYMCFIAGYGITMLIFYKKNKVKGTEGSLPKFSLRLHTNKKNVVTSITISVLIILFVWWVLNSTMYKLLPLNFRLFWLVFATFIMSIGYYVSGCEADMLENSSASKTTKFLYNLIQYIPLFLLVLFYAVIKSFSGFIGQMQNMVLMYIFTVPIGNYIRKKLGNRLIGAIFSSFLFQALMITSAALISMF